MNVKDKIKGVSDKIKRCQEEIRQLELKGVELKTNRDSALKRLKDEFKLSSVEQAERRLEELKKQSGEQEKKIAELESTLNDVMSSIEGVGNG